MNENTFTITGLEVGRLFTYSIYINNPSASVSLASDASGYTSVASKHLHDTTEGVSASMVVAMVTNSTVTIRFINPSSEAQMTLLAYQA